MHLDRSINLRVYQQQPSCSATATSTRFDRRPPSGPNLALYRSGPTFTRTFQTAYQQYKKQNLAPFSALRSWDGELSQQELLLRDQCILVDGQDKIVGSASKKDAHRFDKYNPEGLLHRAFSVFLFDSDDRLLLQQRAAGKVTFPSVWTNTCCSHPLVGQQPPEEDSPSDIKSGSVPGVKHAAVRKLAQELGIAPGEVPLEDFRFLTRLHYCAADPTYADAAEKWGEHEVDHILFIKADVSVKPNDEEVSDHRFVTQAELREMIDPASGLLWSPWFRIIADQFLGTWWDDLPKTLSTGKHVDTDTIHKLGD